MTQLFIKKENNARLLLFFAGWGSDDCLFQYPVMPGYDYLLCFDYRSFAFDYSLLDGYKEIRLMAWSMGVWVAACILAGHDYPWKQKLAINGTMFPIHDTLGIPCTIYRETLSHFSPSVLARFRRRMCGSVDMLKIFWAYQPKRSLFDLQEELAVLQKEVEERDVPSFKWDRCIVGMRDLIFPVKNQLQAWKDIDICKRDVAHYNENLFHNLLMGEENAWIKS